MNQNNKIKIPTVCAVYPSIESRVFILQRNLSRALNLKKMEVSS